MESRRLARAELLAIQQRELARRRYLADLASINVLMLQQRLKASALSAEERISLCRALAVALEEREAALRLHQELDLVLRRGGAAQ